jgi:beta-phosphoglucomutase-like phosphatase (HAD superfamily)
MPSASLLRLLEDVGLAAFDFDGVIADSEPLHAASYQRLLAELGVKFRSTEFAAYVGKPDREIYRLLSARYGVSLDVDAVGERRKELFVEAAIEAGLQPYPYVTPLLDFLELRECPTMILSLQALSVVRRLLLHWGLLDRFREIVAADDDALTATPKEDLVGTLSNRVGLPPGRIVLFEDDIHALCYANEVGLRTVGVVHSLGNEAEMNADVLIRHPYWS